MKQTIVFLVDDSEIYLIGIKQSLSKSRDIIVAGEAKYADEVLQHSALTMADVVLLDVSLQTEDDGIDLIQPILEQYPKMKIIMLSHNKDIKSIVRSIQSGAKAYLAKDTSSNELTAAIQIVMRGNVLFLGETIPPNALINCFSMATNSSLIKMLDLSNREIEVIECLSKGLITKEISEILHVDISTVESHKEHIKKKLKRNTIVEIVVFSLQNGIISGY
jgi:DNA-binding NarL/FixJ family response regulator